MYILLPTKDHGQHHYTRSEIALKNDQYQNAIESCNKAIELEPDHPNIYEVYGNKAKALNKLCIVTKRQLKLPTKPLLLTHIFCNNGQ